MTAEAVDGGFKLSGQKVFVANGHVQLDRNFSAQALLRKRTSSPLRIADLVRDAALIPQVQDIAERLWREYPSHAQAIINRWIGDKEQYGHA